MFEVRAIVADKKLHEVLRLLKPITLEPPVSLPVDTPGAITASSGTSTDSLLAFVKGKQRVTAKEMRLHIQSQGGGRNTYSYGLKKMLVGGYLKKTRIANTYEVVRK